MIKFILTKITISFVSLFAVLILFLAIYSATVPGADSIDVWLSNFFQGEFGEMRLSGRGSGKVTDTFFKAIGNSSSLLIPGYILGFIIGASSGLILSYFRHSWINKFANYIITMFLAIPAVAIVSLIILIMPRNTEWLHFDTDNPKSMVIPILILSMVGSSIWTMFTRRDVSKILESDYVLIARAKGYSEFSIFKKYIFKNIIGSFLSRIISTYAVISGMSFMIENFFSISGIGSILFKGADDREMNLVMFSLFSFLLMALSLKLIADIIRYWLDPLARERRQFRIITLLSMRNNKFKIIRELKGGSNGK